MSIWIKNQKGESVLAPHSYEKTIVADHVSFGEKLLIWLEGVNAKFSFHTEHYGNKNYIVNSEFRICGGAINTNAGIKLTKNQLQEIVDSMKEGATLNIAACNSLYLTKDDLKYSQQTETVEESFNKDNNMIQISGSSFAPTEIVKDWLQNNIEKIHPDYREYCSTKLT